jgi:CubicO group peptidase (beta-lactamase class C family)
MPKTMSAMAALLMLGIAHAAPPRNLTTAATGPIPAVTPTPTGSPSPTDAPAQPAPLQHSAVALTAEDLNAWLDGYLPYALHTADIAGAVVAVVKDGRILTERGYGYSDVAARTPVDPKLTLFRPGSVSKLVTWTAVMQLVEQGKIDLDADVNGYLDFKIPSREGKPITMRNLMQHVAGFEEQAKGIISEDPKAPGFETLLKEWVPQRVFAPGSTPAYSNYGASLAGYIVQRVSGEPFDTYIEKHILQPLDMQHSSFRQPLPANLAPLMSKGYQLASEPAHPFEIIGPAPAGAMSSPAEDMAHFMISHLQNGEYHGNRILSAATAETMHNSPLTLLPPLNRMELGFFETNINDREVIGHLGDTSYFHTSLHLFLKEGVGFYVSFNSTGKNGAAGGLRTALFDDFADRYFPAPEAPARVDVKTTAAHAAMLVGHWVNSRGSQSNFLAVVGFIGQTKVSLGPQGELVVPFNGLNDKPRHWVEVAPFLWRDREGHERLAAQLANGKVVRFSIDELSPFMVFDRAPWYQDGAWLLPLLYASLGALALTALLWPVRALVRRHYKTRLALEPAALRAFKLSRIAALLILAGLGLWAFSVLRMINDLNELSASFDPVVHLAQAFGAIVFIGGFAAMLWNLVVAWRGGRRWPARLWSLVLALAALVVLWVVFAFHLIGFGVNY